MTITPQTLLKFIAGAAAAAGILFLVWYFSSIVIYILVSAVLAIVGRPCVGWLSRLRWHGRSMPRWLAALMTLLMLWVVFTTLFSLLIPLVFDKLNQFATLDMGDVVHSIEEPIERAQNYLHGLFSLPERSFSLPEALTEELRSLIDADSVNSFFSSIVSLALSTVVAVFSISFITFFFLKDEGLFYGMVTAVFPVRYQANVTRALDAVTLLLSRYFTGLLVESVMLMIAISVAMIAFGMEASDAFFTGLIMGVMNVVPYAGPLIGGLTAIFMGVVSPIEGMSVGRTMTVIACTLLVVKGCDDFVLQPTLYSERVKAHPLEIFLVILIAGSVAGIVGMLLAIPSYTVLRVFAKEFFSQYRLVQRLTEKI